MKEFEALYSRYYERVYAFAYRLCADSELANDLAQETFLQAYTSFHRFRGECDVFTWLASIEKHVYFKYLKKKNLQLDAANLDLVVNTYCAGESPEEYVGRQDVRRAVRGILDTIPQKYRDVVVLRIYAEVPFSEVASALKISENSAKVIYFRAKKMLTEVLKDELQL